MPHTFSIEHGGSPLRIALALVFTGLLVGGAACTGNYQMATEPAPSGQLSKGELDWDSAIRTYRILNQNDGDIVQEDGYSVVWVNTTRDSLRLHLTGLPLTNTASVDVGPGKSVTRQLFPGEDRTGTYCYRAEWTPVGKSDWAPIQGAGASACNGSPLMDTRPKIIVY